MKIVQIFRKKNPVFYSIEAVFTRVREAWHFPEEVVKEVLPANGISLKNLRYLYKKFRNDKQAIFHITGDVHYVLFALPFKRTVLTIHDCVFLKQHTGLKRWVLKKLLLDFPVTYSKYITTISEKSKDEIIGYTHCDPAKITVIANPVSSFIFYREQPFNSICPVLLFVGNTPNKNLERVCAAIQNISCKLFIIGNLSSDQKTLLNSLKINFEATHSISNEAIADCYAEADIVLFPSLYEGFGLPILEGYKAGRAVITSNIPPMNQVAGTAACLVDPYNTAAIRAGVLKTINDSGYRNSLIKNGFEQVLQYQAESIAVQYYNLYHKVNNASCVE